jgi:hypothetical protein
MYKSLLEDEKYAIIGGNYDGDGREVLVKGMEEEVCCVLCGRVRVFKVKCVKKGGAVKVVLDYE